MQEDERALMAAIDGGDTELIYMTMLHVQRKRCALAATFVLCYMQQLICMPMLHVQHKLWAVSLYVKRRLHTLRSHSRADSSGCG